MGKLRRPSCPQLWWVVQKRVHRSDQRTPLLQQRQRKYHSLRPETAAESAMSRARLCPHISVNQQLCRTYTTQFCAGTPRPEIGARESEFMLQPDVACCNRMLNEPSSRTFSRHIQCIRLDAYHSLIDACQLGVDLVSQVTSASSSSLLQKAIDPLVVLVSLAEDLALPTTCDENLVGVRKTPCDTGKPLRECKFRMKLSRRSS